MTTIEDYLLQWLGCGKTFKGMGETGLVREIISAFQSIYPQHTEEIEQLEVLARITGYGDVRRMLGASICASDGSRTLTLTPVS